MDNLRDLRDIFSSIHSIAKARETSHKSEDNQLSCRCGKSHHIDFDYREETDLNSEEIQDTDGIYIENTANGAQFFLCPVCNPRINCRLCGGTGHMSFSHSYILDTHDGITKYQSETIKPNACSCIRLQTIVEKLNLAKIPDKYIHAEFSSFNFNHIYDEKSKKKLMANIEKVAHFCQSLNNENAHKTAKPKYFMTLFGPVGSGKTLLATAALKMLITNYNLAGKFVDFQYLLSKLRAEYDEHKTGETILNELRNTPILVIDEFGKGRNDKEWQLEKLDDLVNHRYNNQKITFITTNYLPQNFKYQEKDIPFHRSKDIYAKDIPINETFWQQSLSERIGMRMYERILEVSEFVDFTDLPSYRKYVGKSFLELYSSNH